MPVVQRIGDSCYVVRDPPPRSLPVESLLGREAQRELGCANSVEIGKVPIKRRSMRTKKGTRPRITVQSMPNTDSPGHCLREGLGPVGGVSCESSEVLDSHCANGPGNAIHGKLLHATSRMAGGMSNAR